MLAIRYHPELATPALVAWLRSLVRYDEEGRYSSWLPMSPLLAGIAEAICPGEYTVLLQAYRDGRAITPCHSDAEGGFILSIGATRTLRLHRVEPGGCSNLDVVDIECVEGTVIAMDGAFHAGWHHQIVADASVTEEKLSLVFRGGA